MKFMAYPGNLKMTAGAPWKGSALILSIILIYSCDNRQSGISGNWIATFDDSLKNPAQYLYIKMERNKLEIYSDEPAEDWYNIPGENAYFHNDSLHFERFQGLEKYDGKLLSGDTVIKGIKQIRGKKHVQFSTIRLSKEKSGFKIPRTGKNNHPLKRYRYNEPKESDGFFCATPEDVGLDTTRISSLINKILAKEIPNIHSLLISKDNNLVLEEYFYDYTPDKPHRVHSVTKSITSALTGIAIDKHFLPGPEEPAWKYFTSLEKSKWVSQKYDIKLSQLLSMTAGLNWKGLTLNESSDDIDMYKTDDYFGYLLNKNQEFTPGTIFCYNNGLSLMLGHIIEKASGMSADSFCNRFLFDDLGIKNYSWDIDDNGITRTDGGLKMRPRDMLKFGLLYLNEGKWNGKQMISRDWILNSTTQKVDLSDRAYAYHWWIKDYNINGILYRTYYALGHGEQAIIIVPDVKLVFVMTAGNYLRVEHRPFEIMEQYILPSLKKTESPRQNKIADFAGDFQIDQTESIRIELRDSELFAVDPAGNTFKLIRLSDNHYRTGDQSREIKFIKDPNGNVIMAEIFQKGQKIETLKKVE